MKREEGTEFDHYIKTNMEYFPESDKFEEDWDRVAFGLNRNQFFKFSLSKFNIYYLSSLLFLAIWIGSLVYNSQKVLKDKKSETNPLTTQKDSLPNKSMESDPQLLLNAKDKRQLKSEGYQSGRLKDALVIDSTKVVSGKLIDLDSASASKNTVERVDSAKVKPAIKKIKYVVRRDTIIQVDTSKLKKKR